MGGGGSPSNLNFLVAKYVTVAGERDIFDFTAVVVTAVKTEGHCVVLALKLQWS